MFERDLDELEKQVGAIATKSASTFDISALAKAVLQVIALVKEHQTQLAVKDALDGIIAERDALDAEWRSKWKALNEAQGKG